ncbi:FAD binding domain-containing protein [Chloroflexota bacterium]
MHLPKFEYLVAGNISEACSLLSKCRNEASIIAGGTDLLVKMKFRQRVPHYLVSIKNIPDLCYIRDDDGKGGRIGY